MKNHHTAIRAALAGLLLATTFAATNAGAKVPVGACVQSCHQSRQACALECVAESECGLTYRAAHSGCVASTLPRTPERHNCFQQCDQQRTTCRADLKACKTGCGTDFQTCKDDCSMGG
jgi:hypothetical protein